MAVVEAWRALADTRDAFDGVAATYDRSNAANGLLSSMRERSRAALTRSVPPGARILDLGCGPGTDDVVLGRLGYEVTAVDWSPAMVDEARRVVRGAGVESRVCIQHLGIHQLDELAPQAFDAAFSNFGPLNCVPDLAAAARAIAGRLTPRGVFVASVIGRGCPWELAVYAARLDWRRAAVRFSPGAVPVPLEGRTVWTRYFWPSEFVRPFSAAGLTLVSLRGLGLFAPPPYLDGFAGRHARVVAALQRVDDRIGGWPGFRSWGDHFIVVMKKA